MVDDDLVMICGTAEAVQQVTSQGHAADRVFLTSGMIRTLLDPVRMPRYRANVAALHNRAVFEIPAILDAILARHSPVQ